MEVRLTPEQEAVLLQLASHAGVTPEVWIQQLIDRMLVGQAWYIQEIEKAIALADRGDLIDHEEVVARFASRWQA